MYLVHYLFSVWLQFLLLGVVLPGGAIIAVVKAAVVFGGTVALSFGMVGLIQRTLAALRHGRKRSPSAALRREGGVVVATHDASKTRVIAFVPRQSTSPRGGWPRG